MIHHTILGVDYQAIVNNLAGTLVVVITAMGVDELIGILCINIANLWIVVVMVEVLIVLIGISLTNIKKLVREQ